MIAARGPTLIELDTRASEPQKPHGIITVDCKEPFEYDDGISVEALPTDAEMYRVNVFVADTSPLYHNPEITDRLLVEPEAKYTKSAEGKKIYEPMLDLELIRKLQFLKGPIRDALIVSFVISEEQPPTDVNITYGQVEIVKNLNFGHFAGRCLSEDPELSKFGRAAAMIKHHLEGDGRQLATVYDDLVHNKRHSAGLRGNRMNRLFMTAACHLPGVLINEENGLAIYRTQEQSYANAAGQSIARYSTAPGPHTGIGLTPYTRITSPLRRAEDFVMNGLLRARHEGRELDEYDHRVVEATVTNLNERVAAKLRLSSPSLVGELIKAS